MFLSSHLSSWVIPYSTLVTNSPTGFREPCIAEGSDPAAG